MPPATEPWDELVLQALEARLLTIQGGSDYWHSMAQVRRVRSGFQTLTEYPGIEIALAGAEHERPDQAISDGFATAMFVVINVLNEFGGEPGDVSREIIRLKTDVQLALLTDHRLGATVRDVRIKETHHIYPSDNEEQLCGATLLVELPFETARTNPYALP